MKVKVTDECIACNRCAEICPEVFEMGEKIAQVKVDPVPKENEAAAREASEECPVAAIIVMD